MLMTTRLERQTLRFAVDPATQRVFRPAEGATSQQYVPVDPFDRWSEGSTVVMTEVAGRAHPVTAGELRRRLADCGGHLNLLASSDFGLGESELVLQRKPLDLRVLSADELPDPQERAKFEARATSEGDGFQTAPWNTMSVDSSRVATASDRSVFGIHHTEIRRPLTSELSEDENGGFQIATSWQTTTSVGTRSPIGPEFSLQFEGGLIAREAFYSQENGPSATGGMHGGGRS